VRSLLVIGNAMLVSFLAGCAMQWVRPNTTEAQFEQDRFKCEEQAARLYPPAFETSGLSYQAPVQTNCATYGNQAHCTTAAGIQALPRQSDGNATTRANAVDTCLRANGYVLNP
jgi:hypothetical protein